MGIYHCKCKRCGNEWDPVRRDLPRRCPACKSDKWGIKYWVDPKSRLVTVKAEIAVVPRKVNLSEKRPVDKLPDCWGRNNEHFHYRGPYGV